MKTIFEHSTDWKEYKDLKINCSDNQVVLLIAASPRHPKIWSKKISEFLTLLNYDNFFFVNVTKANNIKEKRVSLFDDPIEKPLNNKSENEAKSFDGFQAPEEANFNDVCAAVIAIDPIDIDATVISFKANNIIEKNASLTKPNKALVVVESGVEITGEY